MRIRCRFSVRPDALRPVDFVRLSTSLHRRHHRHNHRLRRHHRLVVLVRHHPRFQARFARRSLLRLLRLTSAKSSQSNQQDRHCVRRCLPCRPLTCRRGQSHQRAPSLPMRGASKVGGHAKLPQRLRRRLQRQPRLRPRRKPQTLPKGTFDFLLSSAILVKRSTSYRRSRCCLASTATATSSVGLFHRQTMTRLHTESVASTRASSS